MQKSGAVQPLPPRQLMEGNVMDADEEDDEDEEVEECFDGEDVLEVEEEVEAAVGHQTVERRVGKDNDKEEENGEEEEVEEEEEEVEGGGMEMEEGEQEEQIGWESRGHHDSVEEDQLVHDGVDSLETHEKRESALPASRRPQTGAAESTVEAMSMEGISVQASLGERNGELSTNEAEEVVQSMKAEGARGDDGEEDEVEEGEGEEDNPQLYTMRHPSVTEERFRSLIRQASSSAENSRAFADMVDQVGTTLPPLVLPHTPRPLT